MDDWAPALRKESFFSKLPKNLEQVALLTELLTELGIITDGPDGIPCPAKEPPPIRLMLGDEQYRIEWPGIPCADKFGYLLSFLAGLENQNHRLPSGSKFKN